jgi:hypothetical protein
MFRGDPQSGSAISPMPALGSGATLRSEDLVRVAAMLWVAFLALPSAALASDRFTDARGDAGAGPDITAVTLSHTDAALTIAVEFASTPPLGFDEAEQYTDMLLVGIHTDDDLRQRDVEFWTGVHGVDLTRATVVRAARRAVVGSADVTVEGATVTLEVERGVLGAPEAVAVAIAAGREYVDEGDGGGEGDLAPASGPHRYVLTGAGRSAWLWAAAAAGSVAAALAAVAAVTALRRRNGAAG